MKAYFGSSCFGFAPVPKPVSVIETVAWGVDPFALAREFSGAMLWLVHFRLAGTGTIDRSVTELQRNRSNSPPELHMFAKIGRNCFSY